MASSSQQIPVDPEYEAIADDESILGDSSRISLATSIGRYRYENGRRYHAYRDGQYWAPNDDMQNANQTISHHLFLLTLADKLFLAPLDAPRRAIDIGTGTGIWALDFADQFPDTTVIGTDLSPIQPDYTPPNVHFEIDDCCSVWTYPNDHFDFVHIRLMYASVADWPALYQQCYEHLAPGGYIEQAEILPVPRSDDGSITPNDVWDRCGRLATACGERIGKTMLVQERMKDLIAAAGFVDVVETEFKWPIGPWSTDPKMRDLGMWNLRRWDEGFEGWIMALLTRHMGWTYQEVKAWDSEVKKTIRDRRYHCYQDVSVVYARKPL